MDHSLRITSGVTGANPLVCTPFRKTGFTLDDFDGCLDAPNFIAKGSTHKLTYEHCGVVVVTSSAITCLRS